MHLCSFMHDTLVDTFNPGRLNSALWPSLSKCINVFECVYTTLNMRKAAQQLNMSLGAVSYNINKLEDALKMKTFTRRGRNGLVATNEGKKLHDYTRRIKASNRQIKDTLDECEVDRNIVKIVAHPLAMPMYVMPAIAKIDKNKFDYSIDLSIKSRDDALEDIMSGKVDIVVYPLEWSQVSQYQDTIDFVKVAPYKLMLYINKANKEKISSGNNVTWQDLQSLNLEPINKKMQLYTAKDFLKMRKEKPKCKTDCIDIIALYRGIQENLWSVSIGDEFEKLCDCSNINKKEIYLKSDIGIIANWFVCSSKKSEQDVTKYLVENIKTEMLTKISY